jgi:hypothetical protein
MRGIPLCSRHAPDREQIGRIYATARYFSNTQTGSNAVKTAIEQLGAIRGITILQTGDFDAEVNYRCAEYAFGTHQGEPWATKGFTVQTTPALWQDPMWFLSSQGYRPTLTPRPGDVVAYGGIKPNGATWLEHFGIYQPHAHAEEAVVSKFGQGPIVRHLIDLVSPLWGDQYWFFRRSPILQRRSI